MKQIELLQRKLDDLRFRGFRGTSIKMHRAIYQFEFKKTRLIEALLLPLILNVLTLCFLSNILGVWKMVFVFWQEKLGLGSTLQLQTVDLGRYMLSMPTPALSAEMPGSLTWWLTLEGCLILLVLTILNSPQRFMPLTYILRACLLIQATALAYFYWLPELFPHDAITYISNSLEMSLFLIFMTPWILALTYYVFDFPLLQKIALSMLMLGYFIIALPMQYLLHAYALHYLSLLFLPLFYLVFGIFLDVMMFVALYSWGMSWRWRA